MWDRYDLNGDGNLSGCEIWHLTQSMRDFADMFGWVAAKLEWGFLYLLAADNKGRISKDDIRASYDGSLFYRKQREREKRYQ